MNPVLSQLPRAQDAYSSTVHNWTDVDTTPVLLAADQTIKDAIARGLLCSAVSAIQDFRVAEKAALELQEIGYATTVVPSGQMQQVDGSFKTLVAVQINWKYMPANVRDGYSI